MEVLAQGGLYVVATPIGNLEDISYRAVRTLVECDLILAENPRHSLILLRHYGITTPLQRFHEHNERDDTNQIVERIVAGQSIALISDAGMPLISDPGFVLVRSLRQRNLAVTAVPGASAVLTAISISGITCARFGFEGFLPSAPSDRQRRLQALRMETHTLVFFEAPHRLLASLQAMATHFGSAREAFLGRELTKKFEVGLVDTLGGLCQQVEQNPNHRRGECVIVVAGTKPLPERSDAALEQWLRALLEALPLKQAVAIAAAASGHNRNHIYQCALRLKGNDA